MENCCIAILAIVTYMWGGDMVIVIYRWGGAHSSSALGPGDPALRGGIAPRRCYAEQRKHWSRSFRYLFLECSSGAIQILNSFFGSRSSGAVGVTSCGLRSNDVVYPTEVQTCDGRSRCYVPLQEQVIIQRYITYLTACQHPFNTLNSQHELVISDYL